MGVGWSPDLIEEDYSTNFPSSLRPNVQMYREKLNYARLESEIKL